MLNVLALVRGRIKSDDMARHGLMMAGFSITAGLFNYLYQLAMGRMLDPEDYGILVSFLSLLFILSIFSLTIQTSVTKFVSRYEAEGRWQAMGSLWGFFLKWTLIIGVAAFGLLSIFSPMISGFLKVDNLWYSIVLFSALIFNFAVPAGLGVLNGLQRFIPLGLSTLLLPLLKLVLAILLVKLGMGIYGSLFPILLATLITFIFTLYLLRGLPRSGQERVELREVGSFTGLAFLAMLFFTVLTNVDVIMAKHYLTPTAAGNYAALSVLGRVALFATTGIALAMFPKTSGRYESGDSHLPVLKVALLLTVLISGAVVVIYWIAPGFVVNLLGTDKYTLAAPYLFRYALGMMLFAIAFLLMNYFLSLNRTRVAYYFGAVMLLQIALMGIFHSTIAHFATIILISGVVAFLAMLACYLRMRLLPSPRGSNMEREG